MPFQSEKQRRYLWANEPEIARDWTDTYGSGIAKALGGRIPFYAGNVVATNIDNPVAYDQFSEQLNLPFDFSNTGDPYKDNLYVDRTQQDINTVTGMKGYQKQEPNEFFETIKDYLSPNFTVDDLIQIQKTGKKTEPTASLTNDQYLDQNNLYAFANNIGSDANIVDDIDLGIGSYPNIHGGAQFKSDPMADWGKDIDPFGRSIDESIPQSKWSMPRRLVSGALNWGLDKAVGIPFVGSVINAIRNYEPNQIDVMNRGIVNQLGGMDPQTGRDRFGTNVVSMFGDYQQRQEDIANFYNTPKGQELMKKWDYHKNKAAYANTYLTKNPIYQDWKKDKQGDTNIINLQRAATGDPHTWTGGGTSAGTSAGASRDPGGTGGGSRQATSAGATNTGRTDKGWGWAQGGLADLWQR